MTTESAPATTDTAPADTNAGQNQATPETTASSDAGAQDNSQEQHQSSDPRAAKLDESNAGEQNENSDFQVPEAYKDKPWASKVKSQEDLWKQIDNLDTMVGRKNVAPDFDSATPQEIEDYKAQTRPDSPEAYKFDSEENYQPSGLEPAFAEAFHKQGIHPHVGNELIKDLQGVLNGAAEAQFDADGFLQIMEQKFGNGYEMKINQTRQLIESNLNDADKAALDNLPNQQLALLYQLASNMQSAYGANENGLGGEHKAGAASQDIGTVRADIRKQIDALDKRPHSAQEKQDLVDRLHKTYQGQPKTNKR